MNTTARRKILLTLLSIFLTQSLPTNAFLIPSKFKTEVNNLRMQGYTSVCIKNRLKTLMTAPSEMTAPSDLKTTVHKATIRPVQLPLSRREQATNAYINRVAETSNQTKWEKERNRIMAKHNIDLFCSALQPIGGIKAVCRMFRLSTAADQPGSVSGIPGINEDEFQHVLSFLIPTQKAWQLFRQLRFLKPCGTVSPIGYISPIYDNDVVPFPSLTDLGLQGFEDVRRLDNEREIESMFQSQEEARAKIRALPREEEEKCSIS